MGSTVYQKQEVSKRDIFDESSESGSNEYLLEQHEGDRRDVRKSRILPTFYLAYALLLFNALWSVYLALHSSSDNCKTPGPNLIHSPARSAVSYEVVATNSTLENTNEFRGKPSPAVTAKWHDSYTQWAHISVSEEEFKAIGRESLPFADGSGYLGTLEVFHQLHCLNMVREYIFPDYYWTAETKQRAWEHADHCIDTIRLALMCHGDIALVPFKWEDGEQTPVLDMYTQHECRNWDNILEWAKGRQADMSQVVRT